MGYKLVKKPKAVAPDAPKTADRKSNGAKASGAQANAAKTVSAKPRPPKHPRLAAFVDLYRRPPKGAKGSVVREWKLRVAATAIIAVMLFGSVATVASYYSQYSWYNDIQVMLKENQAKAQAEDADPVRVTVNGALESGGNDLADATEAASDQADTTEAASDQADTTEAASQADTTEATD